MRRRVLATLGIAVLANLGGCNPENAFVPPPPPKVTVAPPSHRTVTTYAVFTGRLEPTDSVEIRARVRGYLDAMHFEPGRVVQAGDLLFSIQPQQYQADLQTAQADLAQKVADLELQEATLQRVKLAFDRDAATELEVLQQQALRDGAAARVQSAEAAVTQAELNLSYTSITSPIEGRVSRERVDVGNLVGATDATLLTTVVDDSPMYVYFNVSERDLIQLLATRGRRRDPEKDPVQVFLSLADGSTYDTPGDVLSADNTINPETGTIEIRARVANDGGLLAPGMFVRVRVPNDPIDAILVPEVALQRDLEGDFALVVGSGDTVERRAVTLGEAVENERIITSGLSESDRVIISGLQRARPGRTVTVEMAATAPTAPASPEQPGS